MLTDAYVKRLADQSQVQATVPDCMKYSAHFEYQDLCSRLIRAQRQLGAPEAPHTLRTSKTRLAGGLKPVFPRSKSTNRPRPPFLTKSIQRPLSIRKVLSKELNSSARIDPLSFSPLARRTQADLPLNRSFTVTQNKAVKGMGPATRSLFRLKPALRK